jgi:predicted amidohydrolase
MALLGADVLLYPTGTFQLVSTQHALSQLGHPSQYRLTPIFTIHLIAIGSEPQDPTLDSADHWQRVMQGHAAANVRFYVQTLMCD